jgi:hypothetical protein
MFLVKHYNVFFSLRDDIKKSSQWFGRDITMLFQQHRDGLLKTLRWIFFVYLCGYKNF